MCKFKESWRAKLSVKLVVTEVIRWLSIGIPILSSVWRYAEITGYPGFISESRNKKALFWGISIAIFLVATVVVYVPIKLLTIAMCWDARHIYGWRISILLYIMMSALPCFTMVTIAARSKKDIALLDSTTATVLQVVVFCLTVTEWCAKVREEKLTYDLVAAMGNDFFTAYDIIEIIMVPHHNSIVQTPWMYVIMSIAFLAMFKYLPVPEEDLGSKIGRRRATIYVLFNLIFQEVPFLIVRVMIKIMYGLKVVEIIYPAKNLGCILMYMAQLYIILSNSSSIQKKRESLKRSERQESYKHFDKAHKNDHSPNGLNLSEPKTATSPKEGRGCDENIQNLPDVSQSH